MSQGEECVAAIAVSAFRGTIRSQPSWCWQICTPKSVEKGSVRKSVLKNKYTYPPAEQYPYKNPNYQQYVSCLRKDGTDTRDIHSLSNETDKDHHAVDSSRYRYKARQSLIYTRCNRWFVHLVDVHGRRLLSDHDRWCILPIHNLGSSRRRLGLIVDLRCLKERVL